MPRRPALPVLPLAVLLLLMTGCAGRHAADKARALALLNVSYDPTREFYADYNAAFARHWKTLHGQGIIVKQSHGGSAKQARSVIEGLDADVVTLGIASDIDALQSAGDVRPGWQSRLPGGSVPYTSTIVFLVRAGNPKHINDWSDLTRPGVQVITPNPKTSSGGRWNYLAAWGYSLKNNNNSQDAARAFARALYHNVPVLDSGARGATNTFTQRGIGDVLLAWESDALLAVHQPGGAAKYQVVYPSVTITAEPPVAVVDRIAAKHGTATLAAAYLAYLYSSEGQDIAARHFCRPRLPAIAKKYAAQFPAVRQFTAEQTFGSWNTIQRTHFDDGGTFDQIAQR